jgi:hypothetical protein
VRRAPFQSVAALLVVAIGASSFALAARSDDIKETCAASFEAGQRLRREGKLRAAKKEFVVCAAEGCPDIIAPACGKWLHEVDESTPTVVVVAKGPKGDQVGDVRVLVDGELVASTLDGKPLPIDPGKHHLRYELDGAEPLEEDVIINIGDHNRRLEPAFHGPGGAIGGDTTTPPPPKLDEPPSGPLRWPAFVTIGVGGAGIIVGAITGGLALGAKSSLDEKCATKTTCPKESQADIDTLSTMSTASTVGFVAGGITAAAGIIVAIALPSPKAPAKAAKQTIEWQPWISPLGAGVHGRF